MSTPPELPITRILRAPYAARNNRGRAYPEPAPRLRSEFQRDRDRVLHCSAFRRLEYKTQVFVNHEGDLFRTRLTHSLEVAQIARTIGRALGLNEDLIEAIALAHDLGHTPFGHAGQDALNECMQPHGGFEHNLQSIRVIDELEERYAEHPGLNLTFETREGVLKHCSRAKAQALGTLGERFLNGTQPSLEAQLTNLADEISYNSHDVDDGLRAGFITVEQLERTALLGRLFANVRAQHPALSHRRLVYQVVRRLIDGMVQDLVDSSAAAIAAADVRSADEARALSRPLIRFSDDMRREATELKRFLFKNLYRHHRVYRMADKAKRTVRALYQAFFADAALMPPQQLERARALEAVDGTDGRARAVADYIAGMTDRFAIAEHERLFDPARLT